MKKFLEYLKTSVLYENAPIVLLLGLTPFLMMSSSLTTGTVTGISAAVILVLSGVTISLVGKFIPDKLKTPVYLVITATFVAVCEILLFAFLPSLRASLGIYLPLLTVSGLAFVSSERAAASTVGAAALSSLALALGYFAAILVMSFIREFFGNGTLFGFRIIPEEYAARLLTTPFGALFLLGIAVALIRTIIIRAEEKEGKK